MMMLVHEVLYDTHKDKKKMTTTVRVVAGIHHVKTDDTSNGIFQQPLHIHVEQGTKTIDVEWSDSSNRLLAIKSLDVLRDVLEPSVLEEERFYTMRRKGQKIQNPRIKLTLGVSGGAENESYIPGASNDVADLVRMQLAKARAAGKLNQGEELSEIQVLKEACAGPLEVFEGLGKTNNVHAAMVGPPTSRRWFLGIWIDKDSFLSGQHPITEVDLMRIQSVQADPSRHHVFVINYFDGSRVRRILTFRRVDRARDVWVEIIRLTVQQARDVHAQNKSVRQTARASRRSSEISDRLTQSTMSASSTNPATFNESHDHHD